MLPNSKDLYIDVENILDDICIRKPIFSMQILNM